MRRLLLSALAVALAGAPATEAWAQDPAAQDKPPRRVKSVQVGARTGPKRVAAREATTADIAFMVMSGSLRLVDPPADVSSSPVLPGLPFVNPPPPSITPQSPFPGTLITPQTTFLGPAVTTQTPLTGLAITPQTPFLGNLITPTGTVTVTTTPAAAVAPAVPVGVSGITRGVPAATRRTPSVVGGSFFPAVSGGRTRTNSGSGGLSGHTCHPSSPRTTVSRGR